MRPLARCALLTIRAYQRFISPYKGFCCAHRAHLGGRSCSAYGYTAIARGGMGGGLRLLGQRLKACGDVHRRHHPAPAGPLHYQRGACDVSCDVPSCDIPSCDALDGWLDLADCGCDGCDWIRDRRRRHAVEPAAIESAELLAARRRIEQRRHNLED